MLILSSLEPRAGHDMFSIRDAILTRAFTYTLLACVLLASFTTSSPIATTLPDNSGILEFSPFPNSNTLQRRIVYNETLLDRSLLVKRDCFPSKESSEPNIPAEWICNAVIPGVDACVNKVVAKGYVGTRESVFYTGVDGGQAPSDQGKLRKIWTKGDAPSTTVPKGSRGPTLPAGLPEEDVPPNWQTQPDS
ncbi:hypothetical protein MMC11_004871 [Xylographa trunciseda]|nr:hypothetical protein [Xylographa trunciseda]